MWEGLPCRDRWLIRGVHNTRDVEVASHIHRGPRLQRQMDLERCTLAFLAVDGDESTVDLDNLVGDGESESGALRFRREKRVEQPALDVIGNPRPVVRNFNRHVRRFSTATRARRFEEGGRTGDLDL